LDGLLRSPFNGSKVYNYAMSKILNIDGLNIEPLPSPHSLKQELPVSAKQREFVRNSRLQVERILNGEDARLLLIVGPCSIHDITAAKEYAIKLGELSETVSKSFFVIMRTYFEKPRTALGWKGLLHDPHLDGSNDMCAGLRLARKLLFFLADIGIAAATEFLDPATPRYLEDLVSWSCIGARTSESQTHRQLASSLPMPVAFKNSTSGSIEVAVNGIMTASSPHAFLGLDDNGSVAIVQSKGNPHAHIVLRGGGNKPNYDPQSISFALDCLKRARLPERLLVDCSHDNSFRRHTQQVPVFQSVVQQYIQGNNAIKGIVLESHINPGCQMLPLDRSRLQYAVSLTDPCLDWNSTKELILWGNDLLQNQNANTYKSNEKLACCRIQSP
jgi:3-deoxy-7-phosphoheptulonate synthase